MIAATDETAAGKAAKQGKEGKGAKESKKVKEVRDVREVREELPTADGKHHAILRQLAADLSVVTQSLNRLQTDVDALKQSPGPVTPRKKSGGQQADQILTALSGDSHAVAAIAIRAADGSDGPPFARVGAATDLRAVDSARLARVGYAFSSAPKVALLRLLLDEGEQSAAQLGDRAGLTTGSLYHHLRELVHSEVVHQSSRNRYALTESGRQTLLAFLLLLADE